MSEGFVSIEELGYRSWSFADNVEDALYYGTSPDAKDRARGHVHASIVASHLDLPVVKEAIGGLSEKAASEFRQILEINGVRADLDL